MEIEKIVRIAIWIAFIMLAFLSVHYKFDACNVCKLEYKEQNLDGSQFFNAYAGKCLIKEPIDYNKMINGAYNFTFTNP